MTSDISLLTDILPESVDVAGAELPIETDFRCGIQFERMILDNEVSDIEKVNTAIEMYFGNFARIRAREEAIEAILWFYSCGRYGSEKAKPKQDKSKQDNRYYDYSVDARMIYAAFRDQYGVDLQSERLHWWKFCAMIAGLKADTEFMRVIGYRAMDLSKIKNRQERARYQKLQTLYALPDNRSHDEKVASAGFAFGKAMGL